MLAQVQPTDSSFLAEAIRYQRAIHQKQLADNARLYNGTEYKEIFLWDYDKGHPYFVSKEWQKGFIEYNGQRYENVDLLYDLFKDKVLTHQYYTFLKIDLIREKITSFGIDGHTFIQVSAGDSLSKLVKPGFYDWLEHGNVSLYALRKKERTEDLSSGRVVQEFMDKTSYFIVKDGKAFGVKTRKDLYKVLSDKKSMIKKKLSENRVNFRKQPETALRLAVKHYNSSL